MGCGASTTLHDKQPGRDVFNYSLTADIIQQFENFNLVHGVDDSFYQYRNYIGDESSVNEDILRSYFSRYNRLLLHDLETLLCTEVTKIQLPKEENTDWTKNVPYPDKFFDMVIVLNTCNASKAKASYRTYAHKAILAARSQFFNSKLGVASHHKIVSNCDEVSVARSLPDRVSRIGKLSQVIQVEFEMPSVVQDVSCVLMVLEYLYTGLFRQEFSSKLKSLSDENNMTALIEIASVAQYFSVLQLKNCAMFHMCDIVEKNSNNTSDFAGLMKLLCPTIPLVKLKKDIKLALEIENVYNDYKKLKRKLFYSPMQSKRQLEKDFEKMYIQSNTSSMTSLSSADFTDVRLAVSVPGHASIPSTSPSLSNSVQFASRKSRKMFRVHKSILTARCAYFKQYFLDSTNEDLVEMPSNFSFPLLKAFIHYLYTDALREEHESLYGDLLTLAETYVVPGLRMLCLKAYYEKLTPENVLEEFIRNQEQATLRNICFFKMAYLYPEIVEVLSNSEQDFDRNQLQELKDKLKVLYLSINHRVIWDRTAMSHSLIEKLVNGGSRKSRKILVIGEEGVGRKTITRQIQDRLADNELFLTPESSMILHLSTEAIPVATNDKALEKMNTSCDGYMLVFSLSNYSSFQCVESMFERIRNLSLLKPVVLVGNKVDEQFMVQLENLGAPQECVDTQKVIELAKKLRIPYIETQADLGVNMKQAAILLAKEMLVSDALSAK